MTTQDSPAVPAIVLSHASQGSYPFIKPSDLPTARFKYDVWHDLKNNEICADELKNPRVRKGPRANERHYDNSSSSSGSEDEEKGTVGKKKDKKWWKVRDHRDKHENWKEAVIVNLSYQNLGDDFQVSNFLGVLHLLKSCVELHISYNELRDLSKISLPSCKVLNLTSNHITTFKDLPRASKLEHLNLTENDVSNVDGLERFKHLKTLHLTRNPVSYIFDYRPHVFSKLPRLAVLDDIPKKETDEQFEHPRSSDCIIA